MRILNCSFCGAPVYPGHGTCFVRNDGSHFYFCRSKCNRAFKKKVNPRKVKWTKAYRLAKGKELSNDTSILAMVQRRDCPVKYSREHHQKTVEGMKKIVEIKHRREAKHIMDRLKEGKKVEMKKDQLEVDRNIHLIRAPAAGLREKMKMQEREMESDEDEEQQEEEEMLVEAAH